MFATRVTGISPRKVWLLTLFLLAAASSGVPDARVLQQGPIVIGPEGESIPVEQGSDCTVSVAAWENETWVDPASPEGTRRPKPGLAKPSTDATTAQDVADIVSWLKTLLANSKDMRDKTKGACEALGVKHIAIRLVRDDPKAKPGAWKIGTNLILLDMGKVELGGKQIKTPGTGNPSLEDGARQTLRSLLGPTLIPHEMDHIRRARSTLAVDQLEALAVQDENTVIAEYVAKFIEDGRRRDLAFRSFTHDAYMDGAFAPYTVNGIKLRVDWAAAAAASVQGGTGGERRFVDLDDHDHAAVDEVGNVWFTGAPIFTGVQYISFSNTAQSAVPFSNCDCGASPSAACSTTCAGQLFVVPPETNGIFALTAPSSELPVKGPDATALTPPARPAITLSMNTVQIRRRGKILVPVTNLVNPPVFTAGNVTATEEADTQPKTQRMGGSLLGYAQTQTVVAGNSQLLRYVASASADAAFRVLAASVEPQQAGIESKPGAVHVLFTSLGSSQGEAFTMTVLHDSPSPLRLFGSGVIMEPVANLTNVQADQALAKMKAKRSTVTISAYCLDQPLAPPTRNMLFRLAPQKVQDANSAFARIMLASKRLKEARRLRPDTDPVEYFHSIRQWAVWADRQRLRDEPAFARAVVDDAKKRVAEAGQRWTREIETEIRALVPNRWQDVRQVLALAGR